MSVDNYHGTRPAMMDADATRLTDLGDLQGSLADRVYAAVKKAILALEFPPGTIIRKSTVCDKLGVSRSPVSDALNKLSTEGLVDVIPQSGTRVARLSMAVIREDAFLREALEVAAVRHAAMHRSEEQLARLSRSMEMQRMIMASADRSDFHKTDIEFHAAIMATVDVSRLAPTVRKMSLHVDRARLLLIPEPGRLADTLREHTAIFETIQAQDVPAAEDAMRNHVQQLLKRLAPLEAARPDLFSK